jgi:uncharacterized protein
MTGVAHVAIKTVEPVLEASVVRPLSAAERLALVDVLRGIAILGVLVAYTMWSLGSPPTNTWTRVDHIIDTALGIVVDGKFLTMFAFLFGVGTSQQWRRIESHGHDPVAVHLRRMLFLLSAGLVHATLLRNGDILAPYAILGVALLAARHRSSRQIAIAALILAVLPYVAELTLYLTGWKAAARPSGGGGAWFQYWGENLDWVRYWYLVNPWDGWPRILAIMLAGVLADRARFLTRLATDRRLALQVLGIALPIAIGTRTAVAFAPDWWNPQTATFARGVLLNQTYHLSSWSLAAAYAAAIALLCQRPAWPARLAWLRAVGRMAFTNYLGQSLLIVPICLAFGLFDQITPTKGLELALGVMAVEIPFSVWWLKRHQYGPVEWLWRAATYGTKFAERSSPSGRPEPRSILPR